MYVLNSICKFAISERILFLNPCQFVRVPSTMQRSSDVLIEKEISSFIGHCSSSPYRNAIAICLAGALRRSELLGLPWRNVDFKNKTITISQQLIDVKYKEVRHFEIVNYTKNGHSRTIRLPDSAFKYLQDEKNSQEENKQKSDNSKFNSLGLVFTDPQGNPIRPNRFLRNFKKLATSFGKPDLCVHGLRHTTATLLMNKSNDLYHVMEYLGHSHPAITLEYIESTPDSMSKLVTNIDKCLDIDYIDSPGGPLVS